MKFILIGFEFESSNKGCEALSYAVMSFLDSVKDFHPLKIVNINIHESMGEMPSLYPEVEFTNIRMRIRHPEFWLQLLKELRDTTAVLDITHGDSFSDIYGEDWFKTTTLVKSFFAKSKVPFILMPQTYGPFKKEKNESWAKKVIKKADMVYTRDSMSKSYLEKLGIADKVYNTLDMAFMLPYEKKPSKNDGTIHLGINISGLLWNDCSNNNNADFELSTDYCRYCREVIGYFYGNPKYKISLIPHVLCDEREGKDFFENDSKAIRELLKEFPNCFFPNDFKTALDAKNYIADLDVLVAARMHASIAGFSSGVPVVPFAYSRKFEGVYRDLDYPYLIDGKKDSTESAVSKTKKYIENLDELKISQAKGIQCIEKIHKDFLLNFKNSVIQSV